MMTQRTIAMNARLPLALTAGAIVLYLALWAAMPLYPDEVAFRLQTARLLADGPVSYGLFGFCVSNTRSIPLLFLPWHALHSLIDYYTGWSLVRMLPFLSILALTGSVLALIARRTKRPWSALLLTGGFLGVAGSGLMLARPEYMLSLHAAACVFTFLLSRKPRRNGVVLAIIALHMLIADLSVAAHLQGVLLLPLSFLSCLPLLRRPLPIALLAGALLLLGYQSYQSSTFHCRENPALESVLMKYQGGPTTNVHPEYSLLENLKDHAARNVANFKFSPSYFYLPPHEGKAFLFPAWVLNHVILALWLLTMLAVFLLAALPGAGLLQRLWRNKSQPLPQQLAIFYDARALVCYAALALLLLYFYDITINFYRVYSRHLLAVALLACCAPYLENKRLRLLVNLVAVASFTACLGSILMSAIFFNPPLRHGYEGPSLSLATDWEKTDAQVHAIAQRCAIPPTAEKLIIDDYTYHALRRQPHLIPITYLWFDTHLIPGSHQGETAADRLRALQKIKPAGIVARCSNFDGIGLPIEAREGTLCCLKLERK